MEIPAEPQPQPFPTMSRLDRLFTQPITPLVKQFASASPPVLTPLNRAFNSFEFDSPFGLEERLEESGMDGPTISDPGINTKFRSEVPHFDRRPAADSYFWTGQTATKSPSSVRSYSSSRNSSLRGSMVVDPEEQNMMIPDAKSCASSIDKIDMSPTLIPPPAKLGAETSFECDICGKDVKFARRRDWQ